MHSIQKLSLRVYKRLLTRPNAQDKWRADRYVHLSAELASEGKLVRLA